MFTSRTSTGLDIGSQSIKLVQVQHRRSSARVKTFGQIPTPSGRMENGFITDPDVVGQELGKLVDRLKLRGAKTVSALSGQQVYTRLLTLPAMKLDEMRHAALYQATSFLPISIEDVTTDIYPVRYFEDEEGKKCEVFFVAARKAQAENLIKTCQVAGLKLNRVEIEPLALHTLYHQQLSGQKVKGVLNIGATRSYLAIFQEDILVFVRSIGFGCTALYQYMKESGTGNMKLENLDCQDAGCETLMRDIVSELSRFLEYFRLQSKHEELSEIILCGGGARVGDIEGYLSREVGLSVQVGDFTSQIQLPDSITAKEKSDLLYDYPVALGLAMRGVK